MAYPKKERPTLPVDERDLLRRAYAAYFRKGNLSAQPSNASEVMEHEGKLYVVLHNTGGILEVYRVRNDGVLKSLKRIPPGLAAQYAPTPGKEG